jgi:DNA-binding MarR family transcriptional regulator
VDARRAAADADDRAWDQALRLHGRVEQDLGRALQQGHALGLSEYRALCRLAAAEHGGMRIQELADAVGLNQSSMSRLVARLEDGELTEREICETDRRGVYVYITENGRAAQAAALPTYQRALTAALDRGAGDPEMAAAVRMLRGDAAAEGAQQARDHQAR